MADVPQGWINLDPEPVPEDDPRVRIAVFVADGAWLRSPGPTDSHRMKDTVRTLLAHLDEMKESPDSG